MDTKVHLPAPFPIDKIPTHHSHNTGSGYVKAIGQGVTAAQPGDPVLLSFDFCKSCALCKSSHASYCNTFNDLNFGPPNDAFSPVSGSFFGQSSFSSLSIVSESCIVNVKDLVHSKQELQLFAPLGCGIQTGSGTVINCAKATPDDVIVILGLGGVGLSAIMGAKVQGCRSIIGIDRIASRLDFAKELGATHVINSAELGDTSLVDAVRKVADGIGPTIAIDTTGVPALITAMLQFIRNKGKAIQVGSAPFDFKLEVEVFSHMVQGKQYIGAIEGESYPPEYIPKMIQLYREGKFPFDKLMKVMPAEEFPRAIKEMHDGTTIKPILTWS